jgi:hypothetical protein
MQLARELVELNGGVVDAYLDDRGKVQGEITVNTRYLVLGDFPEAANQAAQQQGFQEMSTDAQTNGVEKITLDKFLNQMGYTPDEHVVGLGPAARSIDFPPDAEAGAMPNEAQSPTQFRRRSPVRVAPPPSY